MFKRWSFVTEGKSGIPILNHLNGEFQNTFLLGSQEKAHALYFPDDQISCVKLTVQSEKAFTKKEKKKAK